MTSQSIEIRARNIKILDGGISFWPKFFGSEKLLKIRDDIDTLEYSCRLQKTRTGNYFLLIPQYIEMTKSTTTKTCAIDPGIRTMLTGYDPEGVIFEFGGELSRIV